MYKGKAAVSVKAIAPTWAPVGQGKAGYNLKREGTLLFEFAQVGAPCCCFLISISNKRLGSLLID